MRWASAAAVVVGIVFPASAGGTAEAAEMTTQVSTLVTASFEFAMTPETGAYRIADRAGGVTWRSSLARPRFGQATLRIDGKAQTADLARAEVRRAGDAVEATFRPIQGRPDAWVRVRAAPGAGGKALDLSWEAWDPAAVESIRLLDDALAVTDADGGYVVVPAREGLLIPATSGLAFTHRFNTYSYEGCHMQMAGAVKRGAAALVTWTDCYVSLDVSSALGGAGAAAEGAKQTISLSAILAKTARSVRVTFLGKGDYVTVASAYREAARQKGYYVTWDEKLKGHPDREKYIGAINFKLWSCLDRRMNEDSSKELTVRVNWTFDEAAQVAEHLKRDLGLDRVLFTMGGWIRRGYDNQHPDILPTAPECGGDAKFADCCKRVRALGYILSLHDNYQDMYRDSPSWDESFIRRTADGGLWKGGHWAGGICYLTCSQRAVDLARRPQNLPAVKKLSDADSYFIDTTYATDLQECFSKEHPQARADDMKWRQALSDYARDLFGSFGSECGREWAIPHADFFEGLTGVSGGPYHDANLLKSMGAETVPLFEIVYRECIAMYGKYGYDVAKAAPYVLAHISLGRPLNYHNVPAHLYWKGRGAAEGDAVAATVAAGDVRQTGPRTFTVLYRWNVENTPAKDWQVFVHFVDPIGTIRFQNDHAPAAPTSAWKPGTVTDGPFTVTVPEGAAGTFDVRIGLWQPEGGRATLKGPGDGQGRITLGKLKVDADKIAFTPGGPAAAAQAGPGFAQAERGFAQAEPGDPGLFVRADGGWAEGMHPMDRFVKNTYEILSPLNEITARLQMTGHEFLTADRKVVRTVFGDGPERVTVTVNLGAAGYSVEKGPGGPVALPPYGFLVAGPTLVAFAATEFGGLKYDGPAMFVARCLDGKPVAESLKVRVYHGFGDARVRVAGRELTVAKSAEVAMRSAE